MAYATTAITRASASYRSPTQDGAKLLLRVVLGILILLHGVSKLGSGPASIIDLVSRSGLPGALGYLVYVGEIVAPLLLIAGVWTRAAAAVVAINMIVAILLVHTGQFFSLSKSGGWALELQAMFLLVAVAVALLGAGHWSVGGTDGRWN